MEYRIEAYPHNDLLNLAFHNLENINKKVENGDEEGIGLDCLNCIISLAFSVESIINFVGARNIDGWNEFKPYHVKMKQVCNIEDQVFDESIEPYLTLKQLKSLRDDIAHGKPIVGVKEFPVGTPQEIKDVLAQPWDQFTKPDFVNHAYEMVKKFEDDLLDAHKIEYWDAITKAYSV